MKAGLIIFGHGSRDARWAEPFERLAARVRARAPTAEVRLAFLEQMSPDLHAAADGLISAGATSIAIVPVFLGEGGHIRTDLRRLIEALRERHPAVAFHCLAAVGEDAAVLDALADCCLRGLGT